MNTAAANDTDDASEDEIPTLCDLDESSTAAVNDDNIKKLPPVPVTILTGFLGSGKTTLVKYILSSKQHKKRIAVIENEFGGGESDMKLADRLGLQVNDASTLSVETMIVKDGQGSSLADLIELPNGCVCCTVKDSLVETLESLLEKRMDLDYIIIECSGMADPGPVASVFWLDDALDSRLRLDGVVTCVDAKNIVHQLQSTSSTTSLHNNGTDGDTDDGGDEAARQVAYADRIIVNKIDLLQKDNPNNYSSATQAVIERIREINPTASYKQTAFSKVEDIHWILDANCFDADRIKDVETAFQQSAVENQNQNLSSVIQCFNPNCTVDHTATSAFCGLCETDSSSSVALHRHTTAVGTIALFSVGSVDINKLNKWLASILWPNQDEMDKVLRARLEESLRTSPYENPVTKTTGKKDGSVIYRVKGICSIQHLVDSEGDIIPASNDFVDEALNEGFVKQDGLDRRRFIVQAVHDLWDVVPSENLFWDTNETRCCKIIVIGKRLDEKVLREGFLECFV